MPIRNYDSKTFVAFLDISGFKELMKQNDRALEALNLLYQTGYNIIKNGASIEGLFVSDCGILFVRGTNNKYQDLQNLLNGIRDINKKMLEKEFMTMASIAYGQFKYQEKLEIKGIEKSAVYGGAYVQAFLDTEKSNPKIKAGQVRIINENLPDEVVEAINAQNDQTTRLLREKGKYFYYYWSVDNPEKIEDFEKKYNDSYKLVFQGCLNALKG